MRAPPTAGPSTEGEVQPRMSKHIGVVVVVLDVVVARIQWLSSPSCKVRGGWPGG